MLVEPILSHAREKPNEPAIIDDQGQYTYAQLAAMSIGLSRMLAARTTRPTVGLMLPAGVGFVASFYGTLLAGKAVVPINFLLGDREIAHVLKDSGIDTILSIPPLIGRLKDSGLNLIDLLQLPRPTTLPELPPDSAIVPAKSPDDLAVLMYTSGTSGLPKGVELTYNNLQSDVDASIVQAALKEKHVFLGVIPLFHAFGLTGMMLAPIQLGSLTVYIARFSPVAAWNAIKKHNVSLMFAVPSMYAAIANLKSATADDFKQMYAMLTGGEPLPAALVQKFRERFNQPLYEGYGLTETSPVIAVNVPQCSQYGSVGRPLAPVQVRIVDDDGNPLPVNSIGEVWLRGPMIMKGYHNLPAETAQVFSPDGFFKTGDLGKMDGEGFLHITGRKKDMIIVAGEKAYPREIEEVLTKHEAVAEAAVVGRHDARRGELIVAFIVLKEAATSTADALRDFCREQALPQWKIPREVYFVEQLPRSPTGKVLKRILSEQAAAAAEGPAASSP
jgi:long-chain acyl-CoA synthetase